MYLIGLSRGLYEIIHIIRIVSGKCWLLSLSSFLNTGTLQISSDSSNNRVSKYFSPHFTDEGTEAKRYKHLP